MKKPTYNRSDRLPVRKNNPHTPEARERVIAGLRASATTDFVFIVRWLTTVKSNDEPIPLARCDNLRNTISNLETLKAGIQPDWRKALTLMSQEVHSRHKVTKTPKPPSKIAVGVINNLNDISQKIASGNATHDMPARLNYMLQLTTSLEGGDELVNSIREVTKSVEKALRGYSRSRANAYSGLICVIHRHRFTIMPHYEQRNSAEATVGKTI
ncbi:hypothetical protein MMC72_001743 [Salmonella enterica]|nr:hypothetical protein [Salmonella enterica]